MACGHKPSLQGKGEGPVCGVRSVNVVAALALPAALLGHAKVLWLLAGISEQRGGMKAGPPGRGPLALLSISWETGANSRGVIY